MGQTHSVLPLLQLPFPKFSVCDNNDPNWRWADTCHFATIPLVIELFFLLDKTRLKDCKPWPLARNMAAFLTKLIFRSYTFCPPPSDVCQSRMEKRKGRRAVRQRWRGHSGSNHTALKRKRGLVKEKGLMSGAQNMFAVSGERKKKTEQLQLCIHGNHLRTNSSPCWSLLFLQRKWLKEAKVRKLKTEDEDSHADTYPLWACTSENRSHWKYKWTVSHYGDTEYQLSYLKALYGAPD